MIDNILISLSFVFLVRNMNSNEINDLTFKSDRLLKETNQQNPGPGEAWVEQEAIGVNFLDVTQRNGAVPIPLPSGLGLEAAGRVTAVGAGVENVRAGDRVAYAGGPIGAYASGRLYPAAKGG